MLASRRAPLIALVVLSACSDSREPGSPTSFPISGPNTPPVTINPPPPPFPELARPGEIYVGDASLYDFTRFSGPWYATRFVLYLENRFALQFSSTNYGFFEYEGRYARRSSFIDFTFDADFMWTATGAVRGDTLTVKYSDAAALSDFMGGRYIHVPQ